MRILYLYPGKESDKEKIPGYFAALKNSIKEVARPDTEVEIRGLSEKVMEELEMIYWYSHPQVVVDMMVEAKKAERDGFDAVVIGCVGAVEAEFCLKEVLDIPVAGVSESCFLLVQMLGPNFSMLTYNDKVAAWLRRTLRDYDLESKCVSIRPAGVELEELLSREAEHKVKEKMLAEAKKAINEDKAEVILVASAGFVGLADYIRQGVEAPVVDPVEAGIKFAEMLVDFKKTKNLYHSKVATYRGSPNTDKELFP